MHKYLTPFSWPYLLVTKIRNWAYDRQLLKSTEFKIPIIAVGNLSSGGTGKTPMIAYLAHLLQSHHQIAILSRGYKRTSKGFVLANENSSVADLGDEPFLLHQKFPAIQVAVCADRVYGVQQLLNLKNKPSLILLDDAFQHRKIKASLYILLTNYSNLYTDDKILPAGYLREGIEGSKRAHAIVVTKCPKNLNEEEKNSIVSKLNPLKGQPVYFSTIKYTSYIQHEEEKINLQELTDYQVILITGIANPDSLIKYLHEQKIQSKHFQFPDHHNFTKNEIEKIEQSFNNITSSKKLILTTEKDFVRLQGKLKKLYYLEIKTEFNISNQKNNIDKFIKEHLISI